MGIDGIIHDTANDDSGSKLSRMTDEQIPLSILSGYDEMDPAIFFLLYMPIALCMFLLAMLF